MNTEASVSWYEKWSNETGGVRYKEQAERLRRAIARISKKQAKLHCNVTRAGWRLLMPVSEKMWFSGSITTRKLFDLVADALRIGYLIVTDRMWPWWLLIIWEMPLCYNSLMPHLSWEAEPDPGRWCLLHRKAGVVWWDGRYNFK